MREFPPFKLDTVDQCVWRSTDTGSDERIQLAPKAFGVLRYPVAHAGRLMTHSHRKSSRATILRLANSLGAEERLRSTFLSAPLIRNIIASSH
jgi:hypothetical protein